MAIPENYIDRITDIENGDRRYICPAADKVRVDNDNYEGTDLDEVLDEIADAIDDAGSGGYAPPAGGIPKTDLATAVQESLNLADSSLQPSDKTQLQGAITQLQNALNTLIGSGNVQGAIDTFNEVKAFLNGIDTSDPTLANQLLALSNAISAVQTSLASKANAADMYTKAQTDAAIQEAVEDIEAGETVVVNSDGANIVDEHDNNSVLLAPSARQMKLMYNNIMAMYNALANIAFTNGKPTLDWIGSKTKYTLSYGTLTGCTADVAAGQVNEGGLRIKLTPTSSSYAFTSVLVNGESVATTPANDGLGSVYVDIVVNRDITVSATAVSGFSVVPATGSHFSLSNGSVSAGGTYNGILQPESHYDLPATISATMGGSSITFDGTNNSYDEETGAIKISGVNGNIVITASMTIQDSVIVTLPNDANLIIKHDDDVLSGSVTIYSGMAPYNITFQPATGYKYSMVPTASNGHTITNSGNLYTLEISAADTAGSDFSVSAATELAQMLNVTLPNDAGVVVEDGSGNQLTGTPTVEEGSTFVCVVRCVNGKQFASGGAPAISGVTPSVQSDGSYRFVVNNVSAAIVITATSEAVTAFTAGTLNYSILTDNTKAEVTLKSGTATETTANNDGKYSGSIVVPATVGHCGAIYSVVQIGAFAFWGCDGVTSVTLPEGLEKIGERAFVLCKNMASVNFPSTLTEIGALAFVNCVALTELDFTSIDNLYISNNAFRFNYNYGNIPSAGNSVCTSVRFKAGSQITTDVSMSGMIGGTAITSLDLNFKLKHNGSYYHFLGNSSLTTVNITEDFQGGWDRDLTNGMFKGCTAITTVNVYHNDKLLAFYGSSDDYRAFPGDVVKTNGILHIPTTADFDAWKAMASGQTTNLWAEWNANNIVADLTLNN